MRTLYIRDILYCYNNSRNKIWTYIRFHINCYFVTYFLKEYIYKKTSTTNKGLFLSPTTLKLNFKSTKFQGYILHNVISQGQRHPYKSVIIIKSGGEDDVNKCSELGTAVLRFPLTCAPSLPRVQRLINEMFALRTIKRNDIKRSTRTNVELFMA